MSEKEFDKLYDEFLDKGEIASADVKLYYGVMIDSFEKYVESIQQQMFRSAFQFGYDTAMKKVGAACE